MILKTVTASEHYDALIEEGDDPVRDPDILKEYMDKWDGEMFISSLGIMAEKTALEIGVGTGRLALKTAGLCKSFTGIDISEKTVERARENLCGFKNATLICGDFLTREFSEKYDVIYSSLTFMHIMDKDAAIKKAAALLKPGGRLVISLDKSKEKYIVFGERRVEIFPDEAEKIQKSMRDAGLRILKGFETEFSDVVMGELRVF